MTIHQGDATCAQLEEGILTSRALNEEERAHLEGCEACRRSRESVEAIAQAARGLAENARPEPGEARALEAQVRERLGRSRPWPRWSWATAGIAAVVAAALVLALPSRLDEERSGREILALLDEVDAIVLPPARAERSDQALAVAGMPGDGGAEAAVDADLQTVLPPKYQWLWEILESRGI